MPNKPTSYDDITRSTVPDPDGSIRPSREQVERAFDGTHTRTQDDLRLLAAVQSAVHAHADGARVGVEVRDGRVELRGSVSQSPSISELEDRVRAVEGVQSVENKLVVGS
jgi:osmotically-inducible protein OsmY